MLEVRRGVNLTGDLIEAGIGIKRGNPADATK